MSQDVHHEDFVFRRNALYKTLGIPFEGLRGKAVLEFGPGGGFNAVAVTRYNPELYVFVDASRESLATIRKNRDTGLFGKTSVEVVDSNIFDYSDSRCFDVVIIEGVVPGQTKPSEMLQHAGSFLSVGGSLVTTCTSSTSLLAEVCRRLYRPFILRNGQGFEEQVRLAESIFNKHLESLRTKTRPTKDWVLDSIFHRWEPNAKVLFTMPDSSLALGPRFEFNSSSPRFLIDDRFYKNINQTSKTSNDLLNEQFPILAIALLDCRIDYLDVLRSNSKISAELITVCEELHQLHIQIIEDNSYQRLEEFIYLLGGVKDMLPEIFKRTSIAIDEFMLKFPQVINDNLLLEFPSFSQWWGRGQQYASFTRVA